jgi:tRNA nucleotidyltransferase (CCA-adding enzyme)
MVIPPSQNIHLFLNKLKDIKISLTGEDLIQMGVAPGSQIREILEMLHQAKLNGRVTTREGEEDLIRSWLAQS